MGMATANIEPAQIQKIELFSTLLKNEIDFVISRSSLVESLVFAVDGALRKAKKLGRNRVEIAE